MEDTQRVWGKPPLLFTNELVERYWKEEVRLKCRASLERLRKICQERNCDYQKTVALLR